VARDLYQGVIGIDRTFFTNLYLNLQFFYDFIEDDKESLSSKRKTHGFTFEISDKFLNDDLTAGFRGMYFTSNEGSACEIFAEYKIGDHWQIAPGYMLFNGLKGTRMGQFTDNDMLFCVRRTGRQPIYLNSYEACNNLHSLKNWLMRHKHRKIDRIVNANSPV
jgi:hypothetical protein